MAAESDKFQFNSVATQANHRQRLLLNRGRNIFSCRFDAISVLICGFI